MIGNRREKIIILVILSLNASIFEAFGQFVSIKTDRYCSFIIDGLVEKQLKENESFDTTMLHGKYTLIAKTIFGNLSFRKEFLIDTASLVINITFDKQIEFIEKENKKREKRQNQIDSYKAEKQYITNEIANNMVFIKGGKYIMGSNDREKDEQPEREVTISDFYINKHEVTQKQWMAVMEENPSCFFDCVDCPVENIHWYDAIIFCNTLSELCGFTPYYAIDSTQTDTCNQNFYDHLKWTVTINEKANGYRLPTEAEWEYAAGGSKNYLYAGSNTADKVAWTLENADGKPHRVGQKQPNNSGLYDMSGNVWEWCFDWYSENYYSSGENINPKGAEKSWVRVIRGGSWMAHSRHSGITNRDREGADNPTNFTGFRLVRNK